MKKMIVKSKLENRKDFERRLAEIGQELTPTRWQHERIYVPREFQPGMNFPRMILRTEMQAVNRPPQYSLALKRHIEDSGLDYVFRTAVEDYMSATGIVHQLGFQKIAEVSRQRREVELDEKTVIYLDKVEGIDGDFIKIEAEMLEGELVSELRQDFYHTLSMLGLETVVFQTYAEILGSNVIQPYYLPS